MTPSPDESSTAQTGIRRVHATILFVDLVGFTALSEAVGPEQAYHITTGCLRLLDEIAHRHGGLVDRFQGDALMAIFGHPIPKSDAPQAALSTALEMRRTVGDFVRALKVEPRLDLHVGINTGDVVAGDVRGPVVREFHVLGNAVNIAARLKSKAPIGSIYAGADTHAEARQDFVWKAVPALRLKGKSEPVEAFAVLEARDRFHAHTLDPDEGAASPFMGRRAELQALGHELGRLDQSRGSVVILVGEEGSGKTRLLSELGRRHEISGLELLRAHPRSSGEAAPGELAAGLAEALGSARPLAESLRLANPLLLVLDDLDRADLESLAEIEALLPLAHSQPLMLVLSGQPGPKLDRLTEAAGKTVGERLRSIRLDPLDPESARKLLGAIAGDAGLDERDRETLLARAAGMPGRLVLGAHLAPALAAERARAIQQSERAGEAEQRRATILFADIVGFTAMTETLGAERAYPVVAGCLQLLGDLAIKHGGTVQKFLGDCVMALFGVPEALEDAPRAAVNAAIEMRRRVREYSLEQNLPGGLALDVHTGIYTGRSIAGDVSGPLLSEFAVMGEPVVVASQLTDHAEAGEVHIGPETWRATHDRFGFAPGAALDVPGLADPIESFELRSETEQIYRRQVGEPGELWSELVGREAELGRMRGRLSDLERDEGGFVALVGEAGVGKSRMVTELEREAQGRITWLEGRSISTGAGLGFHPFADLLRGWVGIDDEDDPPAAAAKLAAAVARLLPGEEEEVAPFLAIVMGISLDSEHGRRHAEVSGELLERAIRASVERVLAALSTERPLVLVFDDLHWADLSSIELALELAPLATRRPILFLHVFRPHFGATSGRLIERLREEHRQHVTTLELRPLERKAVRRLITNLFRGADIPQPVRAMITDRASGNPFYVEEVVRSLIEQGAVVRDGGGFRTTERIHETEIPRSVEEVVRSRIDHLPAHQRELVQVASVIGRSFHVAVLRRIFPRADTLQRDLAALRVAGFVVAWDQTQGEELAFKHPLLQEVAYDGQLEGRRRERHLAVAEATESELSASIAGYHAMLAYHFGLGGNHLRAEDELLHAGDEAARSAASNEALQFFRDASRLYLEVHGEGGDPARRATLEKNLGLALYNRGQFIDAEQHFNTALRALGESVPRSQTAMMLRFARNLPIELARLWLPLRRRRPSTARDREVVAIMYRRAEAQTTVSPERFLFDTMDTLARLDTLDPSTVPNAGGMFASTVGIFSYGGLSPAIGRRFLARGAPLVRADDLKERVTFAMMNHLHHFLTGDWSDAHCLGEELFEEGLRELCLWPICQYLGLETEKRIRQGRWDDALTLMDRTSRIWETYGYDLAKTNHYAQPVFLAIEQRRLAEARAGAEAYHDETPGDLLHLLADAMRAEAEILLGDQTGAERTLTRGEEIVRGAKFPPPFHLSSHRNAQLLSSVVRLESAQDEATRQEARREGR
ncbi:MAG: AAA family ATPase, partial [bacterium]|nr:AAA family ATPase [bacterium]